MLENYEVELEMGRMSAVICCKKENPDTEYCLSCSNKEYCDSLCEKCDKSEEDEKHAEKLKDAKRRSGKKSNVSMDPDSDKRALRKLNKKKDKAKSGAYHYRDHSSETEDSRCRAKKVEKELKSELISIRRAPASE